MNAPVASLIETLTSTPGLSVRAAGQTLLESLSAGNITPEAFCDDPQVLVGSGQGVSRYLAQVTWRALKGEYDTLDDVISGLYGVLDRNPPTLERKGQARAADAVVIPEARILRIGPPERTATDEWRSSFEAQVTSGELRDCEIRVHALPSRNPGAARIIPYFWVHATVALYNLEPVEELSFEAGKRSFFVLEPLRQVNATAVARSMACPKPQIDQIRRGRGDITVHTVKGMVVHAMLDLLIGGEDDVEAAYDRALSGYRVHLASIADDTFAEDAFRRDVLSHGRALLAFVEQNPHMREDPQVELRRYSATIGIQGRIDAVFRSGDRLDVVELKTGRRIRSEDHAQLFIYRLLLSDYIRRAYNRREADYELTARLLSSHDGTTTPLRFNADFHAVLEVRNRLLAYTYALGRSQPHPGLPYAGYDRAVCGACPSWTVSRCRADSELFGDRPDSRVDDEALAYFRKFSTLVLREGWRSDQDLADLLDDSRLGYRARNFRTISGARCAGRKDTTFAFEFEENASDLGPGDAVLVHAGQISATASFHGFVRSMGPREATIAIPLHNLTEDTFEGKPWTLDRFPLDYTAQSSQTGLYDFLCSADDDRKRVVLGNLGAGTPTLDAVTDSEVGHRLNRSQRDAVNAVVRAPVFHLVWGPPGTGKTRVVAEIVAHIVSLDRVLNRGGVLVGAFTNTALDKMLLAVVDRDPDVRFVRIGRSSDSPELAARLGARAVTSFSEDLAASARGARELRRELDRVGVIAATAHRASTHPYVRGRRFELTVVDEASQLTEPLTLGLVMRSPRFVLIGDDRQLPPVVREGPLAVSMFERLKSAAGRDAPQRLTLLDRQYRMHPEIMDVSNRLFYEGSLSSGVSGEDRAPPYGGCVAFVPVRAASEGRTNLGEAHAVGAVVGRLLRTLRPEDIGVISPFRAQVALLRQMFGQHGVTTDTVERFQGGEREVIVLSLVRSRSSDFVFDDRRFNVAITRARRKLILIGHPELFRNTKYEWLSQFREDI